MVVVTQCYIGGHFTVKTSIMLPFRVNLCFSQDQSAPGTDHLYSSMTQEPGSVFHLDSILGIQQPLISKVSSTQRIF